MKTERRISFSRPLGVGLGVSAAVHVALVAGYATFASAPVSVPEATATAPEVAPPPALEVVRLPVSPPAPTAATNSALASEHATEAMESPRSPRITRAMLTENPAAADVALRMARVGAPVQSELTAVPVGAVNTLAGQVDAPTGADGWFPGKYTLEHGDHEHPVLNGFVLGLGRTCSFSGIYTSVNQRSPFGN